MFDKFDKKNSLFFDFNEGGGDLYFDRITGKRGSIRDGTITRVNNEHGKALNFVNTLNTISVDQLYAPSSGAGFTVAGRLKPSEFNPNDKRWFIYGNPSDDDDYGIRIDFNLASSEGQPRARIQIASSVTEVVFTGDTWVDDDSGIIAVTYDGATLRLYTWLDDGTFVQGSTSASGIVDTASTWITVIGGDPVAAAEYEGDISWVLTVPQGLTLKDVKCLIDWADRTKKGTEVDSQEFLVPGLVPGVASVVIYSRMLTGIGV